MESIQQYCHIMAAEMTVTFKRDKQMSSLSFDVTHLLSWI